MHLISKRSDLLPYRGSIDKNHTVLYENYSSVIPNTPPMSPISPKDIFLSANILLKKHGSAAEEYATQKILEFKQAHDEEAASTWHSILDAIKELRNTGPPETVN